MKDMGGRFWRWLDTPVSWFHGYPIYLTVLIILLSLQVALLVIALVLDVLGLRHGGGLL